VKTQRDHEKAVLPPRRSVQYMRAPQKQILSVALCIVLISSQAALDQTPAVTYQGRLNDNGSPATGLFDLRFALYGTASGGSAIVGATTNTTGVTNGLFTATLDVSSTAFDGTDRWLEIGVRANGTTNDFVVLAPRQPITATPYAVRAANYSGPVDATQVTGAFPASQLSGTVNDAQLSANVALVNADQLFSGANTFANPANTFLGDGGGLTGLNAGNLASGTIPDERLSDSVARLDQSQTLRLSGSETASAALRIEGPGTNNWLALSNGAIWLPPWTLPSEDGGDAIRGGIYFATAGQTGPGDTGNHAILNIINRGSNGGQLLIEHQSIALEEQEGGEIILGNDGSAGGLIRVRYDDDFGQNLRPGQPGHSHVLLFQARNLGVNGDFLNAYPSIIAFHGQSPIDTFPSDPYGNYGPSSAGVLAFYTSSPWPWRSDSSFYGGCEMGRMETNGWSFRGTMTYQKATLTVNSGRDYALDFGTNNYLEINLNTSPMAFRTVNPHSGVNSVQTLTLILHAGAATRSVSFPPWQVLSPTGAAAPPTSLPASSTTVVRLEVLDGGGDTNTLARFEMYLGKYLGKGVKPIYGLTPF